jgi:hypothetical protein
MNKTLLTIALVAVLVFSVFLNAYLYIQNQNELQASRHAGQEANFYDEFGVVPASNFAYPFSPPVSMYRALQIGLESEGWNKTSLIGMVVSADFVYAFIITGALADGTVINRRVTTPPANYSSVVLPLAGVEEYAWEVTVNNATNPSNPPLALSLVDAQTGSLLPKPTPPW